MAQISNKQKDIVDDKNEKVDKNILYIVLAIVLILIIIVVILVLLLGKNKRVIVKTDDDGNKTTEIVETDEIYATVDANDLANRIGENYTQEYIDKRVKITNLIVKIKSGKTLFVADGSKYFGVTCNNMSSLNVNEGDKKAVVGILFDSVWTVDGSWYMDECKIVK